MTTIDTATLLPCTNCGGVSSDYCAKCGERQPGHHDLSVGHFAHEVVHEFVHLDSKLFRTLRDLIARPGFLTEEYFKGRKSRYIAPLRLFLTLFALQFLAFTFYQPAAIFTVASMKKFDKAGALTKLVNKRAVKLHLTVEELEQRLDERWHKTYSLLQLMNIAGVAVVLKLLHRKRYFAEHLVFAAHFLAFSYILALVVDFPIYAIAGFHPGPLQKLVTAVTIGILLVYLFIAQRRFYSGSQASTAVKTVLLWGGRFAVILVLLGGSLISAIVMVH
ncbi:MAG TPA: DUF3667 domain-containing protein [Thermoanaerobaculia bacterium]|jgi:hypothetical protein|nr:DUF3667 domain-containing protein [Thermoanaerobaculia bacterium]